MGRDSLDGWEMSSRASPPAAATVQISPPETKAISEPSVESAGSAKEGRVVGDIVGGWAAACAAIHPITARARMPKAPRVARLPSIADLRYVIYPIRGYMFSPKHRRTQRNPHSLTGRAMYWKS